MGTDFIFSIRVIRGCLSLGRRHAMYFAVQTGPPPDFIRRDPVRGPTGKP